jgi:ParB-like chromosome segregation protein Spo0J
MKMQNIPLDQIVWNPWRDKNLFPIEDEHVAALRASIKDHEFFASLKGRRRNGKVEIGFGHARFEAAKKEKLATIPVFIADIDDDEMLRLMTDENATQSGSNAGAIANEVAAVTRRIIEGLLAAGGTIVPPAVKAAFEDKGAMDRATGKLRNGTDVHLALGHGAIARYLGEGDPKKALRGERQIREAITTLKQSGTYDDLVDEAVRKYPQPVAENPDARKIAKLKPARPPRRRVLDERTMNVFPNEHQFHAFREAVTTQAAQQAIPVEKQLALAKSIMSSSPDAGIAARVPKKQIGAPYIKRMVQAQVEEKIKAQRDINREEKEAFLAEQREERIASELHDANRQLRGLLSCLGRLSDLARQFPSHPKIGGFAARLDTLVGAIQQFSKKIK